MNRLCAAAGACLMTVGMLALPSEAADHHPSSYAAGVARDSHGRILRNHELVREFRRQTGCGHGYYVDHVRPLSCGGPDTMANLQCLSRAQWEAKSLWERRQPGCPGVAR